MNTRYNMQKALAYYDKIMTQRQDQNYLVADDMARLNETDLTRKDLYHICCKLQKAAYLSTEPFLHQERVDAVRYLLEYGIGNSPTGRLFYLPKLTREQVKNFLLSASLTEVCTLIDIIASENRELYSVERGIDIINAADGLALLKILTSYASQKQPLENQVHTAEESRNNIRRIAEPERNRGSESRRDTHTDPTL